MRASLTAGAPHGGSEIATTAHIGYDRGGGRLAAAFRALEHFPALAASRSRLLALSADQRARTGEIAAVIESDVAIAAAVLRAANAAPGCHSVDTASEAVACLGPQGIHELARGLPAFDFFEQSGRPST